MRGPDAAILDCLFRAFTIRKNSTRYEAQQTMIARESSIELCRAFLQECPRCSRFIEPTRIEHHSCRHHHDAHQSSLEIFSAIRPRDESSRSGMCVWHIPHRNHYDLLRLLVVRFGKLRRNSCEITKQPVEPRLNSAVKYSCAADEASLNS